MNINVKDMINRNKLATLFIIPFLLFVFYQIAIASPRYESRSKLIVQQPDNMATMDAGMALLTGLGVSSGNKDTELVRAYITSSDMLSYLESKLSLKKHFSSKEYDFISRLSDKGTHEDFYDYYLKSIKVEVDDKSGVITVYSIAYSPEMALKISKAIEERAEWFINNIGHQLAESQVKFVTGEHDKNKKNLVDAKKTIIEFQRKHNLFDPEQESLAISKISYTLEGQIAVKKAELKAMLSTMSENAPQVIQLNDQIDALEKQLSQEKVRLIYSGSDSFSLNNIIGEYTNLKINLELALKAYTSSSISLEKSRVEAYRKIKFLVVVEQAKKPENNKYPEMLYNITLFAVLSIMLYIISRIVFATINELK